MAKPLAIHCDNGPEPINHTFTQWAEEHSIRVGYIQPGNPQKNAHVELHNRTIRYSWLSKYSLDTPEEVQDYATQ